MVILILAKWDNLKKWAVLKKRDTHYFCSEEPGGVFDIREG